MLLNYNLVLTESNSPKAGFVIRLFKSVERPVMLLHPSKFRGALSA